MHKLSDEDMERDTFLPGILANRMSRDKAVSPAVHGTCSANDPFEVDDNLVLRQGKYATKGMGQARESDHLPQTRMSTRLQSRKKENCVIS